MVSPLYHLVKQDRRIPVVTSLRDRVFNRRPSLRCRRSCREIHPALQGALLLWCRVALCGRYLTVIEIPISHRRRVAGLNVPIDEGLSSSSCRSGIERTTSTIRDSSHGECNAVRRPGQRNMSRVHDALRVLYAQHGPALLAYAEASPPIGAGQRTLCKDILGRLAPCSGTVGEQTSSASLAYPRRTSPSHRRRPSHACPTSPGRRRLPPRAGSRRRP